ncbi:EAL domain-containing protein [uncultured Massilia sp.]|uniref:bifunctional diguanylate cyclase/phosphodiesterase n=1 Tax=uncultured Massilia sp. TaxID=169973 RepID=UPI0025E9193F|nr:EAL domain-containing protein [uncultured Massilia sp.]
MNRAARNDERDETDDDGSDVRRDAGEWLALGIALALAVLASASLAWSERDAALRAEQARMSEQAAIIGQNLVRQLAAVRSVLENVRATIVDRDDGCGRACQRAAVHALRSAMPGVRAIMLVDRQGRVLQADDDARTRLDDAGFVARLRHMDAARTLYLSASAPGAHGVADIKASLPLGATGPAAGQVLVAVLDPSYFDVVMRSALYAPDMTSAVVDEGGARLLFVPYGDVAPPTVAPGGTPFYLRHLRSGRDSTILRGPLFAGGAERLVAQRTVAGANLGLDRRLVVGVSRSLDAVRAPWRRLALDAALVPGVAGVLGAAALFLRQRRRRWLRAVRAARRAEQAAAAERVELALGGADLGLWDWDLDSGRIEIDARGLAMIGHAAAGAAGPGRTCADWLAQVHPDDRRDVERALRQATAADGIFDVEYRLRHRLGHWVWILSRGKVVERDAAGKALRLVGTRMDISARKQAEAEIVQLAFHDVLTGLPNRRLLLDRLAQALRKAERDRTWGAVLFLDLDDFKGLNDTLGHDVGDQLLRRVAARLREATRETDTTARLGGDEFVVLLEHLGATRVEACANASRVAAKVVAALGLPHTIAGHAVRCTPSVGVALFDPQARSVDDVLKQGDMAMYEAKAAGRNAYRIFDPAMQANIDAGVLLDAELRHALVARQFVVFHQPILDRGGRLLGTEALLRWQHPRRGLVGPAAFIAQAEKSELIVAIGDWVLEAACRQLAAWRRAAHTAGLTVAVNISARQARQPDFVDRVTAIVGRTGADPARLKLELTESLLVGNVDDMVAKMRRLKDCGIGFALDDFGTGYSSLSYLERLPITQLKIDRSFVSDMLATRNACTIVRAIIALAGKLGLEVVAEGVETEAQRRALLACGCHRFQGFLYAPPLPVDALAPWLGRAAAPERAHDLPVG